MTADHQQLRELLGAHALGQLDEPARRAVSSHLAGCAECRTELARLAPVAEALRTLDPSDLEVAPPAHLGDRVLAAVAERRQATVRATRLRRLGAGVLVAASVSAAFGAGTWYAGTRAEAPVEDITLQTSTAQVRADGGLVRHTWGTELKLEASGLSAGTSYTVTFVGDDGSRVSGGTFLGTGTRPVVCSVNAAIARDAAAELRITDPAGGVVLRAELP